MSRILGGLVDFTLKDGTPCTFKTDADRLEAGHPVPEAILGAAQLAAYATGIEFEPLPLDGEAICAPCFAAGHPCACDVEALGRAVEERIDVLTRVRAH